MRCLSVRQPWAELLVAGVKTVEVRSWKNWRQWNALAGQMVAIHAGQRYSEEAPLEVQELAYPFEALLRRPGIVGMARFDGIEELSEERWDELQDEHLNPPAWWREGTIGLRFSEAIRLPRVMLRGGQLGIYELDDETTNELLPLLARIPAVGEQPARPAPPERYTCPPWVAGGGAARESRE